MSIESAKFVVQRGAQQFKCQGDQLGSKLQPGDLVAVQHHIDDTASKYIWDGPDGILDTDWLCCTDDDGKTYKVSGDRFKELFVDPPIPDHEITVTYGHTCISSREEPGTSRNGGQVLITPEVNWIEPQGDFEISFDNKAVEYLKADGDWATCGHLKDEFNHYLAPADEQVETDPSIEPVVQHRVTYDVIYKGKLVDTVTVNLGEHEAGPSYNTGSGVLGVKEDLILSSTSAWGQYGSFFISSDCFDFPHTQCMRPCLVAIRMKAHDGSWLGWTNKIDYGTDDLRVGDYYIFQAKFIVKTQYSPSRNNYKDLQPPDDQIVEFAIKFNDAFNVGNSAITFEMGGSYGFDQQNNGPIFTYD